MATIRALSGNWSFSQGFRRYFSCCFASSRSKDGSQNGEVFHGDKGLDEDQDLKESVPNGEQRRHSYGSVHSSKSLFSEKSNFSLKSAKSIKSNVRRTEGDGAEILSSVGDPELADPEQEPVYTEERREIIHVVKPAENKPGTAYAYEEQDTSSDSDDEVLRHYQQSIQRIPSQRSVHSTRSQKSSASRVSKSSQQKSQNDSASQNQQGAPADNETDPDAVHTTTFSTDPGPGDQLLTEDNMSSHSGPPASHRSSAQNLAGHTSAPASHKSGSTHNVTAEVTGHAPVPEDSRIQDTTATYQNNGFVKDPEVSPDQVSPTSTEQALSAFGDGSMSLGDAKKSKEHLFDVSDLQDREPAVLISKCGNLEVTFDYDGEQGRMTITIHRAQEIPSKDRGGANNTQVRLLLLPTKKIKYKTKVKQGENPEYMETFTFRVPSEEVGSMGVRFRLYGCERMRRERMIGEVVVGFASLNTDAPTTHNLTLEPRSNLSHGDSKLDVSSLSRSDSASSTQSMQHGGMPELLVGLTYNGTTGRLSVEVIKGSNFKNMAMNRAPDTYVKLTLMSPNGQEIARSKTSIRRGQPNPLYKETFMFQVALFQLPDVTLMVSVYNKRSMKRKEMIGWFSLGYSSSGEEEVSHWNDMRESKGEPVCRWHVLLEA